MIFPAVQNAQHVAAAARTASWMANRI